MAESQELVLKRMREQAAKNALEADKLIKGPLAEAEEWALANPDPALEKQERLAEAPSIQSGDVGQRMLTPETRHEANKDFVKAAATEVAANAALGGAGKAVQAALPFIPLKPSFVKELITYIQGKRNAVNKWEEPYDSYLDRQVEEYFGSQLAESHKDLRRVPHPDPVLHAITREYFDALQKLRDVVKGVIPGDKFGAARRLAEKNVDALRKRLEKRGRALGLGDLPRDYNRYGGGPVANLENLDSLVAPYSSQAIEPTQRDFWTAARVNHPSPSLSPKDKAKLSDQLERTPGWNKTSEGFWEYDDSPWEWHEGRYRDRTAHRIPSNSTNTYSPPIEVGPLKVARANPNDAYDSIGFDASSRADSSKVRALSRLDPADIAKLKPSQERNDAIATEFEQALKLIGHDVDKPLTANQVEELTEKLNALGRSYK